MKLSLMWRAVGWATKRRWPVSRQVDVLEQRNKAEHSARRGHGQRKPEPGALPDSGDIANVKAHGIGLAFDEPATDVVEVGGR